MYTTPLKFLTSMFLSGALLMDNQTEQTFEYDFDFDFEITDQDIKNMMTVNGLRTTSGLSSESNNATSLDTTTLTSAPSTSYGDTFSALYFAQNTQGTKRKSPTTSDIVL